MVRLLAISRAIDAFNAKFGIIATYLVLFAALLSAANATIRYGINGLIQLSREYHFLSGIQAFINIGVVTSTLPEPSVSRIWIGSGPNAENSGEKTPQGKRIFKNAKGEMMVEE